MRWTLLLTIALALFLASCGPAPTATSPSATASTGTGPSTPGTNATALPQAGAPQVLRLATTTSTQDSGLLDAILPGFERQYHAKVDVVAVGTGQALKLGENGDADVVLVHARKQEDAFVA